MGVDYVINGVKVVFPFKAYPSQINMMSRIITSINKKQHALIESPTGSGKTLALLCSTLAWQNQINENTEDDCQEENKEENELIDFDKPEKNISLKPKDTVIIYCSRTHKQLSQVASELKTTAYANKNLKMAILSSREHTCVNKEVLRVAKNNAQISDECVKRIKNRTNEEGYPNGPYKRNQDRFNEGCKFYYKVESIGTFDKLFSNHLPRAYDLEDFVSVVKKCKACPFFVSKSIVENANLILCPYNYIIDPLIRSRVEMNLENAIVIIDEAHNVEDCCRSSMTLSFSDRTLSESIEEIDVICDFYQSLVDIKGMYNTLKGFLCSVKKWLDSFSEDLKSVDLNSEKHVIDCNTAIKTLFDVAHINSTFVSAINECLENIRESEGSLIEEECDIMQLQDSTRRLIEHFTLIFDSLSLQNSLGDYVITFVRNKVTRASLNETSLNKISFDSSYKSKSNIRYGDDYEYVTTCTFLCLNPAICFRMIAGKARSVILASGTLSPMASFEPELGVQFGTAYEVNHSQITKQALVTGLCVGPSNDPIRVTFENYNKFKVQDDIGKTIIDVCKTVPNGVLCFFPSFNLMDMLIKRWEICGIFKELTETKSYFSEKRNSNNKEADQILMKFKKYSSGEYDNSKRKGAVLFAVCRGRSSEGIDFSDEMARAVITIGIPFPNAKTTDIIAKRKYNDARKRSGSEMYLDGKEWYNIQAYRALNQALGRCIRHKDDWGLLVLLDDRFGVHKSSSAPINQLSKWVREKVEIHRNYTQFLASINKFIEFKTSQVIKPEVSVENIINGISNSSINSSTKPENKYVSDGTNSSDISNISSSVICLNTQSADGVVVPKSDENNIKSEVKLSNQDSHSRKRSLNYFEEVGLNASKKAISRNNVPLVESSSISVLSEKLLPEGFKFKEISDEVVTFKNTDSETTLHENNSSKENHFYSETSSFESSPIIKSIVNSRGTQKVVKNESSKYILCNKCKTTSQTFPIEIDLTGNSTCILMKHLKKESTIVSKLDLGTRSKFSETIHEENSYEYNFPLNCIFCEADNTIHVPLKCSQCRSDSTICWKNIDISNHTTSLWHITKH